MKIDKLNLDGKKDSIEVLDKIFSAKINKQLVSNVLYKTNANYKGRKAKTKQKNEIIGSTAKIYSCLLYTSPSPRDSCASRMPSSA